MAKDDDLLDDLDSLDFGDDFDLDSASLGEELNDRNPITRVTTKASGAFVDATIGSEANRERLVRESLPKAFQPTYRSAQTIRSEIDKSLDHLDRELRDTKHDAKAAARALLPTMKPFLPAALTKKIDAFSREDGGWRGGELDGDSAEIAAALDSVFGNAQQPVSPEQQRQAQLEKTADMVVEQEKTIKQDSMLQHIINIDDGVRGLSGAQASTVNYRRKMLELGYRQYFTARDILKTHGEAYEKIIPSLEAIAKNTALPDYAKEEFGEITSALMKRNIIEKLSPMNWSRNYYKYVGEAFRNKVSEMAGNARQAMSMTTMMSSGDFGEDTGDVTNAQLAQNYADQAATMAGGAVGDILADKAITPLAAKFQSLLLKNPTMMKAFGAASSALDNPAAFIQGISTGDDDTNVALKTLRRAVDFLGVRGPDDMDQLDITTETSATLAGAGKLTRKTIRAIDHVIPNLLAKIDQSVRRITNPKAALEMYDYERDTFTTVSAWQKRAVASAQNDGNSSSLTNVIDGFFGDIRRINKASEEGLNRVNDPARDIIKKAIEIAAKENCFVFDPRQDYSDNSTPLGLDRTLLAELSEDEQSLLISAFNSIFESANAGISGAKAEGRVYQLKTMFNQRARNHLAANAGIAAKRVNELISIYGIGQIGETDLVWRKEKEFRTRPDYYLGKVLTIRADWFSKGVYSTASGPLYTLRGCTSAIFGPRPDGKISDRPTQLVGENQLQYLRTQTGEHFEAVERTLQLNDGTSYRLNKTLNGSSFINKQRKEEVTGTDASVRFDAAEYSDEDEDELSLRESRISRRRRKKQRQQLRDIHQEQDALQRGSGINVGTLNAEMKGVETRLDLILNQLIANNVNSHMEDIKKLIAEHSVVYMEGDTVLDPKIRERLASAREKARGFGSRMLARGRGAMSWAGRQATGFNDWVKERGGTLNPIKMIGGAFDTLTSTAKEFGRGILGKRDILDKYGNVIISALDIESKRLYTKKPNGEYALITKISDIKGGVYRLSEDGVTYNQVFSVEEIAAKYDELCYHTKTGIQKLATDSAGWLGERARAIKARVSSVVGTVTGGAKRIAMAAWGTLAYLPDLYYSLDPEPRQPRLLARVAKEDGYIDVKTGKPVKYFSDIHGEVRDLDGNVRISQSDFENPEGRFIDAEGNDVTSLMSSIASTARQIRKKTLDAGKAAYGWFQKAFDVTRELGANMLGFMGSMMGRGGFVIGQRLVVDRLEHIYRLLNERLSGSGNSTPLPFEPMKASDLKPPKGSSDPDTAAEDKPKSMVAQATALMRDGSAKQAIEKGKAAAKEQYRAAREHVTGRMHNYTAAFKQAVTKHLGKDPDLVFESVMNDLKTTRDKILSETGVDQAMLDLALLDAEYKNVHGQYTRGEISKEEYKAKIKEMAEASPYKDVYHKTMGVLGKAAKAASDKAKAFAEKKSTAAKEFAGKRVDALKENKHVKGVLDAVDARTVALGAKVKGLFKKADAELTPEDRAALKATLLELTNVPHEERDVAWEKAASAIALKLGYEKSGKKDKPKRTLGSAAMDIAGKFVDWRRSKQEVDPKVADTTIDTDGDGMRDGSYAAKAKQKAADIAQKGFFKNMADAFGSVFGATKGKKKEGGGILSKVMGFLSPMISKMVFEVFKGPFGILTWMKKIGSFLAWGGKGLGSMALGAGKVVAGAAMRYAITPALGLAGSALGAAGGAIAGLAVNPVAWGVVGIAAAAYGAYKAYRWATADRIPKIDQLRVATYGAEDYSRLDLTDVQKTLFLETAVSEYVTYDNSGKATINKMSGQQVFQMIQGWGIDTQDEEAVNQFMVWFQNRFLPVHSVWLTAAKQILKVDKIKDIGNEKGFKLEDVVKLAKSVRFAEKSPIWKIVTGPYDDTDLLDFDDVDELFADTIEDWEDELPPQKEKPKEEKAPDEKPKEEKSEFEQKNRKSMFSFGDSAGNSDELDGRDVFSSKVSSVSGYMPKDDGFRHVKDKVDALTAVRMRLYGCWDLTTQNVNNAYAIEDLVYAQLKMEDKKLVYGGDLKALYEQLRGMGGMRPDYKFDDFSNWFNRLFLPVFTAYIGAVNMHLKAVDPLNIQANGGAKGFLIAKAMWGAPAKYATLATPPFINDEIDSLSLATDYLEASMASLEKMQKAYKLQEESLKKTVASGAPTEAQAKILQATGGKYTLDKDGKVVLTDRGKQESGGIPWKRGATANDQGGAGSDGPGSIWGQDISDSDAHAGGGKVSPPKPSPKRDEAEKLLIAAAIKAGITDPTEIAMLLAQAAHESGGFKSIEENLNYSSQRLLEIFPKYFNPAMAQKYGRDPVAIANIAYGKRMGNKDPGDGYKYRGRGFMQLTGRSNYDALAKKYPQAKNPDWVATPEGAAASAVYYWTNIASGALRQRAQNGDVAGATRIINGGSNGLDDRRNEFGFYMKKIKSGELPIDAASAKTGETEADGPATASAAKEDGTGGGPAPNSIDVMAAGAGKDSPETVRQSQASRSAAEVPARPTGTPERVAAKATADAVVAATPAPAPVNNPTPGRAPAPAAPVSAPPPADIAREQAATVSRAKASASEMPVGRLIEIGEAQLDVLRGILRAVSGSGAAPAAAVPAPINMKR